MAKKEYKRKYTKQDYYDLFKDVLEYQEGFPGAADRIVGRFEELLHRYNYLLAYGKIDPSCKNTLRFLSLFMDNKHLRSRIKGYRSISAVNYYIHERTNYVHAIVTKGCPKEEIFNHLVLALLEMAKRYKDYERASFHNYVDKCFHYQVYNSFKRYFSDPADRISYRLPQYTENYSSFVDELADVEYERSINEISHHQTLDKTTHFTLDEEGVSVYDDSCLNLNWINGITCDDVFKVLTPFERRLLVMSYSEKKTDIVIAEHLGLCRTTVNRKRRAAVDKLQEALKNR